MKYINKKLKNILSSFSPQEIAEFKKFAASPVHSERRSYVPIINWMVSLQNKGASKKPIFPNEPLSVYNQQTLRNRQSELLKLAFEFLILKSLSKSSLEREKLLLKELSERGLHEIFSARMRRTRELVNSLQVDDRKFEHVDELMQLEVSHYMNTNRFEKVYPLYFENSFHYACMTLIVLYAFGMEYEMQSVLNKKYDFNIVRDILSMLDFSKLKITEEYKSKEVYLTSKLHYCLYIATTDLENESYYHESRKIFSKLIPDLSVNTILGIYKWMINYCVRKLNSGRRNFVNELFILFNEKLKAGLISDFSENIFPMNGFRDYVLIGLELNKLDWVRNLLENYSNYLPDSIRDDEVSISYSKIHFQNGRYEESLGFLKKVRGNNYVQYTDTSMMMICNYYELGLLDESLVIVERLKSYIRSHAEIPKEHLEHISSFVKLYSRLVKKVGNPDNSDYDLLIQEAAIQGSIGKMGWIKKKLMELPGI